MSDFISQGSPNPMSNEESPRLPEVLAPASPPIPKTVMVGSQNSPSPAHHSQHSNDDDDNRIVEGTPEREAAEAARKRNRRSGAPKPKSPIHNRNLMRDQIMAQEPAPTPTAPGRFGKLITIPKPAAQFTAEQTFLALSQTLLVTLRKGADQTYGETFPISSHDELMGTLYAIVRELEQLHRSQENPASPFAQKISALFTNVTAFINANAHEQNGTTVKRNTKYFYFTLRYNPELSQYLANTLGFADTIYIDDLHHLNPLGQLINRLQSEIVGGIALLNSTPGKQQNTLYHLLEKRLLIVQSFHDHLNRIETERQAFVGLSHRPLVEEINGLLAALEYVNFDFRLNMDLEEFTSNLDGLRSKLRVEKDSFRRKLAIANNDHTHTIPLNKAIEHLDALDKKLNELQTRIAQNQKTFFNTVQKIGNDYLRTMQENSTVLRDTIDAMSARDEMLYVNAQPAPEFIMPEPPPYEPNSQDIAAMAAMDAEAENAEAEYRAYHHENEFSPSQLLEREEEHARLALARAQAEEVAAYEEAEIQAMLSSDDEVDTNGLIQMEEDQENELHFLYEQNREEAALEAMLNPDDEDEIAPSQLRQMAEAHEEEEEQREAEEVVMEATQKRHRANSPDSPEVAKTQPASPRTPMLYGARNGRKQFELLMRNVDEQIVNAMQTLLSGGEIDEQSLRGFAQIRVNDLSNLLNDETVEENPELKAKIEAYRNRLEASIVKAEGKITVEILKAFAETSARHAIAVRLK